MHLRSWLHQNKKIISPWPNLSINTRNFKKDRNWCSPFFVKTMRHIRDSMKRSNMTFILTLIIGQSRNVERLNTILPSFRKILHYTVPYLGMVIQRAVPDTWIHLSFSAPAPPYLQISGCGMYPTRYSKPRTKTKGCGKLTVDTPWS